MSRRLAILAVVLAAAVFALLGGLTSGPRPSVALAGEAWTAAHRPAPQLDPRRPRRASRGVPPGRLPELLVDLRTRVEQQIGAIDAECPPRVSEMRSGISVTATEDDIAVAIQCARSLAQRGPAFWTYWEMFGLDTTVYEGLARGPRSEMLRFMGSSSFDGQDRLHQFTIEPCLAPDFVKPPAGSARRLRCQNETRALSETELTSALAKLSTDVGSTLGREHARIVQRVADELAQRSSRAHEYFLPQVADDVQRYVRETLRRDPWPACSRHRSHPLVLRDMRWYCERDLKFLGELGALPRAALSPVVP